MAEGKLFVCATPIGNLEDVTLRVLRILGEVDVVAAEDTRITRRLLDRYSIKARLESYHEHNEIKKSSELIDRMKQGVHVALVSNAGMPGLSDPGYRLIQACIGLGIRIEVLPGPFAAVTALVASGLPSDRFSFHGFLPKKQGPRKRLLQELSDEEGTLIFYESCHRVTRSLADARDVLGERRMALARELTKRYEQVIRGTIGEVVGAIEPKSLKGEIVLVIEGASKQEVDLGPKAISEHLKRLTAQGLSKKEAIRQLSAQTGISKRTIYDIAKDISL